MKQAKPRKSAPPKVLERDVLRACLALIKLHGLDIERQNTGAMQVVDVMTGQTRFVKYGKPGNSDLAGMLPDGRAIHIEVKRPGKRPTPKQLERLLKTNRLGGVGMWCDDVSILERAIPRLLQGWRIDMDERGNFAVTDEPIIGAWK